MNAKSMKEILDEDYARQIERKKEIIDTLTEVPRPLNPEQEFTRKCEARLNSGVDDEFDRKLVTFYAYDPDANRAMREVNEMLKDSRWKAEHPTENMIANVMAWLVFFGPPVAAWMIWIWS